MLLLRLIQKKSVCTYFITVSFWFLTPPPSVDVRHSNIYIYRIYVRVECGGNTRRRPTHYRPRPVDPFSGVGENRSTRRNKRTRPAGRRRQSTGRRLQKPAGRRRGFVETTVRKKNHRKQNNKKIITNNEYFLFSREFPPGGGGT